MTTITATAPVRSRRWPAAALACALLAYAAGKASFAVQGRLGLPGGPAVPAAEMQRYAAEVMPVATAQWLAVASGLAGAAVVLATIAPAVSGLARAWRLALSVVLAATLVALGSGAAIVVLDVTVGLGAGWQPVHAVVAVALLALMALTAHAWVRRLRGAGAGRPACWPAAAR